MKCSNSKTDRHSASSETVLTYILVFVHCAHHRCDMEDVDLTLKCASFAAELLLG